MLLSIKVTALAGDDLDQFRLPSLLTLTSRLGQNVSLWEGEVGSFPES